jgi:hypothetical protein
MKSPLMDLIIEPWSHKHSLRTVAYPKPSFPIVTNETFVMEMGKDDFRDFLILYFCIFQLAFCEVCFHVILIVFLVVCWALG